MGKYIKLFNNHNDYETFKESQNFKLPNVSHCINENDVHYNPKLFTLTPKQLVEYMHSFKNSLIEKFLMYRQEHMEVYAYANQCETKLSYYVNKLGEEKKLRYTNVGVDAYPINITYPFDSDYNNEMFEVYVAATLYLDTIRFDYDNKYLETTSFLYKTNETYNGNDVFYITNLDIEDGEDDGTVENLIQNSHILYGDNMVLLCPHDTYANFRIAYPDGNGGYTTTKPASFVLTPSIVNETLVTGGDEWISMVLFHLQDQEINTRVDNAIMTLRSDFKNWFNGDFSALSVLDDIKIEIPKDVYEIIKNPWTYLDEDYIFNGQELSNP